MNSNLHSFNFDVNFGFGTESVFTDVDTQYVNAAPPAQGYFLLLDNTPITLLEGGNLDLL